MAEQQKGPNPNAIIEIENMGDDRLIFPIVEPTGKGDEFKVVAREQVGPQRDRICYMVDEALRDVVKQPSPIARWTYAEFSRFNEVVRAWLRHLIKSGTVRVIQGAELIGA